MKMVIQVEHVTFNSSIENVPTICISFAHLEKFVVSKSRQPFPNVSSHCTEPVSVCALPARKRTIDEIILNSVQFSSNCDHDDCEIEVLEFFSLVRDLSHKNNTILLVTDKASGCFRKNEFRLCLIKQLEGKKIKKIVVSTIFSKSSRKFCEDKLFKCYKTITDKLIIVAKIMICMILISLPLCNSPPLNFEFFFLFSSKIHVCLCTSPYY